MITELEIQNFRGFRQLKLDGLRRVNLLLGGNDTGKTSILEAILLLLGGHDSVQQLATTFRSNQSGERRNHQNTSDDFENFWLWLFREREVTNAISLRGTTQDGKKISLSSKQNPNDASETLVHRNVDGKHEEPFAFRHREMNFQGFNSPFGLKVSLLSIRPTHPVEDAENYNLIALDRKGEQKVEEMMRVIEPRLRRLRYARLPNANSPLIYADIGLPRALPSTQMGQAFNRVLHIYCEILTQKANILLVDEIENGIFTEMMPAIWKGLLTICAAEDVQIFATTHSRECVMAALKAADEREKDELMVYRLQRVRDDVEAVRLEARHLELAAEMGLEVRS